MSRRSSSKALSRDRWHWHFSAWLLLAFAIQPLGAQSADTLGTRLTISGDLLSFRWDPKHPWARQMSTAGVDLFAEYTTQRQGRVVQKLDSAHPVGGADNAVSLRLPSALTAVPTGNVCLYLQVAGGRRIPLRKPHAGDADTELFAVNGWRTAVLESSTAREHQTQRQALENAVTSGTSIVAADEAALRRNGWTDSASCETVKPPDFVARAKPPDVLPSDLHEAEARHLCIRRGLYLRQALELQAHPDQPGNLIYALPAPEVDAKLILWLHSQKGTDLQDLRLREVEFKQYRTDWDRWQATAHDEIQRNVTPVLGSSDDELLLQDVTAEVGREILSYASPISPVLDLSHHPTVQNVLGYVGGGLETYSRCVHDGQDELAAKLKAWNEQVARAPVLEQMSRSQLRTQCLNAVSELDHQRQQLISLQAQLSAERQWKSSTEPQSATSADAQSAVLNGASCAVH